MQPYGHTKHDTMIVRKISKLISVTSAIISQPINNGDCGVIHHLPSDGEGLLVSDAYDGPMDRDTSIEFQHSSMYGNCSKSSVDETIHRSTVNNEITNDRSSGPGDLIDESMTAILLEDEMMDRINAYRRIVERVVIEAMNINNEFTISELLKSYIIEGDAFQRHVEFDHPNLSKQFHSIIIDWIRDNRLNISQTQYAIAHGLDIRDLTPIVHSNSSVPAVASTDVHVGGTTLSPYAVAYTVVQLIDQIFDSTKTSHSIDREESTHMNAIDLPIRNNDVLYMSDGGHPASHNLDPPRNSIASHHHQGRHPTYHITCPVSPFGPIANVIRPEFGIAFANFDPLCNIPILPELTIDDSNVKPIRTKCIIRSALKRTVGIIPILNVKVASPTNSPPLSPVRQPRPPVRERRRRYKSSPKKSLDERRAERAAAAELSSTESTDVEVDVDENGNARIPNAKRHRVTLNQSLNIEYESVQAEIEL